MPDGQVLEFTNVTKRFNEVTAVSDFSARVEPGAVTAFLGPNGAGKTTSLRILLGQVRATSGTATIGGTPHGELRQPLRTIGSVLEETAYRPRRSATRQLTIVAKANGIPLGRVDEVLAMVGLGEESDSRIGGFSLGMRQRLSVAHALLGDPGALVFDEPANGLDPEGIRWMRLLMRRLADEGRTVLVSSHLLSEIEQVADNVLVLSKGRLVLSSGIETLADPKGGSVVVDAADRSALTAALSAAGFDVEVLRSGLTVRGADAGTVGAVAAAAGIALSTLVQRGPTLEDVFIDLVRDGKLNPRADVAASPLVAPEGAGADGDGDGDSGDGAGGTAADAVASGGVPDAAETDVPVPDENTTDENTTDESPADETPVEESPSEGDRDGDGEHTTVDVSRDDALASEENPVDDSEKSGVGESSDAAASDALEAADGDEALSEDAPQEDSFEAAAPAVSFDEILFGAAAPVSTEAADSGRAGHRVAELFADSEGVPSGDTQAPFAGEPSGETANADEGDHAGVEFFTELGAPDAADHAESDDAVGDADPANGAVDPATQDGDGDGDGDDPRSAAVSSMLAAAARAYYEDEPKDYPQGEDAPDDGAHWSIASTGVIDTVPLAESSEGSIDDEGSTDDEGREADDDGGNDHDGQQHDGQQHDGEDHHDEHHHG